MPRRERIEATHDWHQLALRLRAVGQRAYALIRPVVLFGQSPAERAAETGAAERTLYRQVARFDQLGMAILDAKREHPPLNVHELATICWARFGHRDDRAVEVGAGTARKDRGADRFPARLKEEDPDGRGCRWPARR